MKFFLVAFIVGVARYLSLNNILPSLLSTALFFGGVVLAHLLFVYEPWVMQKLALLIRDTTLAQNNISFLRHGLVVLALPILAIFALSSTRVPIGLGFVWGIMAVYTYDLFLFVRTGDQRIGDEYFYALDAKLSTKHLIAAAFSAFTVLYAPLLILSRFLGI